MMDKQEIVRKLIERGVLITPDMLDKIDENTILDDFFNNDEIIEKVNPTIAVPGDVASEQDKKQLFRLKEQGDHNARREHEARIDATLPPIDVVKSYSLVQTEKNVEDFVNYFNDRYNKLRKILMSRSEMESITNIRAISSRRESVSFIGMVKDISETRNGNIIFQIEDQTGEIKAIVSKSKPEVYDIAKNVVLDEVIGVNAFSNGDVVFVTNIIFPDVPLTREIKKTKDEQYALFIGDIHIGSKYFMKESFNKLMRWIKAETQNEKQNELSKKTKYIFFLGDNVEGIGIYPNQINDLEVSDVYKQYEMFEDYVLDIPDNKRIIIIPGNHDASRISEPQPPLDKRFVKRLYEKKNISFLSSPSFVNIAKEEGFSGINVLLYHGYSFPYYGDNVSSIRSKGGLENVENIMSFLMQKRHLAPTHTSTLYIPGKEDHLVIDMVPDIFATGHVHRTTVSSYKSIILINASCWMEETDYQRKVGLKPQPAKAVLVGLHNRQVRILNFN